MLNNNIKVTKDVITSDSSNGQIVSRGQINKITLT